jgi:hypothetical protein
VDSTKKPDALDQLCPQEIAVYQLGVGELRELEVVAACIYSSERIQVSAGQEYEIRCDPDQTWKDAIIKTGPEGFINPLALLAGIRLKGTKCFCLCGAFDETEKDLFPIGIGKNIIIPEGKKSMSFFANDAIRHYENNKGAMTIQVLRTR